MKKPNLINFLLVLVLVAGGFTVVKHFYMKPGLEQGQKAPDFMGTLPTGEVLKFSELKGNYILLDFWGSWCGPCIEASPKLIALHDRYGSTNFKDAAGFSIVSVAIEKDKERWLRAMERLGLDWPYQVLDPVSNFKFFDSPIANEYDVKQLPTKFLIDEKGKIVMVNPSLEEVDEFLREQL